MNWLIRLSLPLLFIWLMLATPVAAAEQSPADAAQPATGQEESEPAPIDDEALDVLMHMAETLAQAQRFSVTFTAGYDVVQEAGQKITFGERRSILLGRPDRLRVEAQESDGRQRLVTFDGTAITVFDPAENVYGRIEKAGSVDDAVRHIVSEMKVRLPLALLLVSTLPSELERRLQSLDYVERDVLTPVPTDHLAGQTADVDFEIWVAAEGPPLPQRVVVTYKAEEGAPQYRAALTDWNLDPAVPSAQVAFVPPEGAQRIPFLVNVRRPGSDAPSTPGPTEGTPK